MLELLWGIILQGYKTKVKCICKCGHGLSDHVKIRKGTIYHNCDYFPVGEYPFYSVCECKRFKQAVMCMLDCKNIGDAWCYLHERNFKACERELGNVK